jgi:hypothetical protein
VCVRVCVCVCVYAVANIYIYIYIYIYTFHTYILHCCYQPIFLFKTIFLCDIFNITNYLVLLGEYVLHYGFNSTNYLALLSATRRVRDLVAVLILTDTDTALIT